MTQTLKLSPPLAELAADPSTIRAATVWAALPPEDRRRAVSLAVSGDRSVRSVLIAAIRKTPRYKSFRADSFNSWPAEQVAGAVQAPGLLPAEAIEASLIALHIGDRSQMLGTFLDTLGIPHEAGVIGEVPESLTLTEPDLARAADDLAMRFPPDHVAAYAMTLLVVDPALWGGLRGWLASRS